MPTSSNYYQRLGILPWASPEMIRQAYRRLSKAYHPDTSSLPPEVAIRAFHDLQEAYLVLIHPQRRALYDARLQADLKSNQGQPCQALDPLAETSGELSWEPRPLSGAEIFSLFLIAVAFLICLILVGGVAYWQEVGSL